MIQSADLKIDFLNNLISEGVATILRKILVFFFRNIFEENSQIVNIFGNNDVIGINFMDIAS